MKHRQIANFVRLAKGNVAYDMPGKAKFHREGIKVLRQIAQRLGLEAGSFEVRSNLGGIAVSGEITLHCDWLYVQFSQSCLGPEMGFMYRRCKHREDYSGGQNRWMKWDGLLDLEMAVETFQQLRPAVVVCA